MHYALFSLPLILFTDSSHLHLFSRPVRRTLFHLTGHKQHLRSWGGSPVDESRNGRELRLCQRSVAPAWVLPLEYGWVQSIRGDPQIAQPKLEGEQARSA